MSRFISPEAEILNFLGDILGTSVAVVEVGYDQAKKSVKNVNKKVKDKKEYVKKEYAKKQYDRYNCHRAPKLSDFVDHIIAQDTATVIFWKDGSKTAVKCSPEEKFDYEKGIAMATLKYIFGNKYYQEDIRELIEKYPYTASVKADAKKTSETKKTNKKTSKTEE